MIYWEDLAVGWSVTTPEKTVSREEIIDFAEEYDPQPFHLDEEAAKKSILGGLCASGWHIGSIAMRMVHDSFHVDAAALGSPGIAEMRWQKPLYVGDTVFITAEVTGTRESQSRPDMGITNWHWTMTNQRGQTVMTCDTVLLMGRRDTGAS